MSDQLDLIEDEAASGEEGPKEPDPRDTALAEAQARAETERSAREAVEKRLAVLEEAPKAEAVKSYTRAELQEAVDTGTITEEQRDETLRAQDRATLKAELAEEMRAERAAERQGETVAENMAAYRATYPDIEKPGTDDRKRLEAEYAELTRLGMPVGIATELVACRNAFGAIRKGNPEKTASARETHREAGGGGRGDGAKSGNLYKGVPPAVAQHYQKLVSQDFYKKGESDPVLHRHLEIARKTAEKRAAGEALH